MGWLGDPVYGEGMISAIAVDGQAYWNEDWEFAVSHLSGPRISPHKDTRVKLLDYLAWLVNIIKQVILQILSLKKFIE